MLPLILLASGCTFHQGGVRLINFSDLFNSHPDYVTVRKGDTFYSISRRYNVPIRDLVEANGLTPPYTLTIGRVLRMPGAQIPYGCQRRHPVQQYQKNMTLTCAR